MKTVNIFDLLEWDELVQKTYNRPYSFQQQDGCRDRGIYYFSLPCDQVEIAEIESVFDYFIPELVDHQSIGIKFESWLKRDPKEPLNQPQKYSESETNLSMWWERNFYPNLETMVNDLHKKGILKDGEYAIDIDW